MTSSSLICWVLALINFFINSIVKGPFTFLFLVPLTCRTSFDALYSLIKEETLLLKQLPSHFYSSPLFYSECCFICRSSIYHLLPRCAALSFFPAKHEDGHCKACRTVSHRWQWIGSQVYRTNDSCNSLKTRIREKNQHLVWCRLKSSHFYRRHSSVSCQTASPHAAVISSH